MGQPSPRGFWAPTQVLCNTPTKVAVHLLDSDKGLNKIFFLGICQICHHSEVSAVLAKESQAEHSSLTPAYSAGRVNKAD